MYHYSSIVWYTELTNNYSDYNRSTLYLLCVIQLQKVFFKALCDLTSYWIHKKVQNFDEIKFLDAFIFCNSDFMISKYKAKKSGNKWLSP